MSQDEHRREIRRLGAFVGLIGLAVAVSYAVPAVSDLRPWVSGEPVPLLRLLTPAGSVQEDAFGELFTLPGFTGGDADDAVGTDSGAAALAGLAEQAEPARLPASERLPRRDPAIPSPMSIPEGAFDSLFDALASAEAGEPGRIVRILHWGDSTIASDGITGRMRQRMQARFGDGGPGFLPVHADPRWASRPGVLRYHKGDWETLTITFGGAEEPRYGLAGMVSTAGEKSAVSLGGLKIEGSRQPLHRFDVFYQLQPGGGGFFAQPRGSRGKAARTDYKRRGDSFLEVTASQGARSLYIATDGEGPVSIYGVALETSGPGVTWETLGVAGSSTASILNNQSGWHLKTQTARRSPDLIVYQTGGNELSYPGLKKEDGQKYAEAYLAALGKLREGAPEAPCLIIGPVDQARRERGQVVSKPMLDKMLVVQRRVAQEAGCGFWDARHVMGGDGGFLRWMHHEPRLAWTDLMHLTTKGLDLVGDSLADALLLAYDDWREKHPDAGWRPASSGCDTGEATDDTGETGCVKEEELADTVPTVPVDDIPETGD